MHNKIIKRIAVVQWIELAIAIIIVGGLTAFNIWDAYKETQSDEREKLITQANVVSKNLAFQIESANDALITIIKEAASWEKSPGLATQRLSSLANAMPAVRALSVFDASGTLIYCNFPQYVGLNFSYRDYYKTAKKSHDSNTLYITPPFKGLSGNYVLNLTRVISGKSGQFSGIVTATLDPNYFKPLLASVLYSEDSRSSLVHSSGALFLNQPEFEKLESVNLAKPGSFFSQHIQSESSETIFSGKLYATKEQRMIAHTTLKTPSLKLEGALIVAFSRDLGMIFKSWKENSIIQLMFFILFIVSSVTMLYLYQRHEAKYKKIASDSINAMFQSEKLFRSTYDSAAIGMTLLDIKGNFLQANRALCNTLGYDEEALCKANIKEITHPDDLQTDHHLMEELLANQREHYQIEKRFAHKNGNILWALLTYSSLKDIEGNNLRFVVQVQDITEYKFLQEKLRDQADNDFLTKLPNRRHFIERANAELSRLNRNGGSLAFLLIDIDHFKRINDSYGHFIGDSVLQQFSEQCKSHLRNMDLVSRYGGEEFAVILPETNLVQAIEVAERLRVMAEDTNIAIGTEKFVSFTISVGLATVEPSNDSLETILVKVDAALYNAKQTGRNKLSIASSYSSPIENPTL